MNTVVGAVLVALGALIAVANWSAFARAMRGGRQGSTVPFVGSLLLFFGLAQFDATVRFAWLAFIVDWGTLSGALGLLLIGREMWQTRSAKLAHRFGAEDGGRRLDIRLFKEGRFTIRIDHHPPVAAGPAGAHLVQTSMTGDWHADGMGFQLEGHRDGRTIRIGKSDGPWYLTREEGLPEGEPPADAVDGVELFRTTPA